MFLKLYDGIPHQVALNLIWSLYGFFWQVEPGVYGGGERYDNAVVSIQFFRDFYDYDASKIRSDSYKTSGSIMLGQYIAANESVSPMKVPRAGWHCSWCFHPEGIRKKLLDAPRSDFPRYGDYPGKTEPKYIERLIKYGMYFDRQPIRNGGEVNSTSDPEYAPPYILKNNEYFKNLLVNPYKDKELPRVT